MTSTTTSGTSTVNVSRPYCYRPGTDGCDETWDIVSTKTGSVVAAVPFWELRDETQAIAEELTSAKDAAELLGKIAFHKGSLYFYGALAEILNDALGIQVRILDIDNG